MPLGRTKLAQPDEMRLQSTLALLGYDQNQINDFLRWAEWSVEVDGEKVTGAMILMDAAKQAKMDRKLFKRLREEYHARILELQKAETERKKLGRKDERPEPPAAVVAPTAYPVYQQYATNTAKTYEIFVQPSKNRSVAIAYDINAGRFAVALYGAGDTTRRALAEVGKSTSLFSGSSGTTIAGDVYAAASRLVADEPGIRDPKAYGSVGVFELTAGKRGMFGTHIFNFLPTHIGMGLIHLQGFNPETTEKDKQKKSEAKVGRLIPPILKLPEADVTERGREQVPICLTDPDGMDIADDHLFIFVSNHELENFIKQNHRKPGFMEDILYMIKRGKEVDRFKQWEDRGELPRRDDHAMVIFRLRTPR